MVDTNMLTVQTVSAMLYNTSQDVLNIIENAYMYGTLIQWICLLS